MSTPIPADMTPQQLLALLTSELSASGSVPITAATTENPDAPSLTLREAVAALYWSNEALVNMNGEGSTFGNRPWPPTELDNLLGHVLSMRAEGLITQALLASLCENVGLDTAKIIAEARAAL